MEPIKLDRNRKYWVFDIDGTLCSTDKSSYESCEPDDAMIALVNMLYDKGDFITLYTARGSTSGIDWCDFTEKQLKSWGVKYHRLILGKPFGDVYVDDMAIRPDEFLDTI